MLRKHSDILHEENATDLLNKITLKAHFGPEGRSTVLSVAGDSGAGCGSLLGKAWVTPTGQLAFCLQM